MTHSTEIRHMRGPAIRIAGWLLASSVAVVISAGFGCGIASAESGENSSEVSPSSSDKQQAESSSATPDNPKRPDTKPATSPSDAAGAKTHRDVEEPASELKPAKPAADRISQPRGRALRTNSASDESIRRHEGTAAIAEVNDEPVGQTSSSVTAQPQDADPDMTELARNDVQPRFGSVGVNSQPAADPAESTEASATETTSTASPSVMTGQDPSTVELRITPETISAVRTLADIAQREGHATPLVTTAANPTAELDSALAAAYTGQPSFIHQVVVVALRVINAVLSPFGGILSFTGLKVPIFADGVPPFFVTADLNVERDSIAGLPVYVLTPPAATGAAVVALHGGAYVAEASLFHWELYADLARKTGATVIVADYPLIGEAGGTADIVVPQTAELISKVIATRGAENTYVLGDSAGGGLALAAVQLLVASGAATPRRMVLLAPWLDATVSDAASATVDDPLLNVPSLVRFGEQWAGELGPTHPWASPINGSLDGLPPITVFSGSLDLLSPQALRLRERALAEGADITFELRNGLMHAYPIFFFLPDALAERPAIYRALLEGESSTRST